MQSLAEALSVIEAQERELENRNITIKVDALAAATAAEVTALTA